MLYRSEELARHFADCLGKLGAERPARLQNLRASSLFLFLQHLLERNLQSGRSGGTTRPLLLITETTQRAAQMLHFLQTAERLVTDREPDSAEFLLFPDFEPQNLFEFFDPPLEVLDQRNRVLDGLRRGRVRAVVTSYKACWRLLPELAEQAQHQILLCRSAAAALLPHATVRISREGLASSLHQLGYQSVSTVTEAGQFAVRGGLVDVFPIGAELPTRIDLFGDLVDGLSLFDPVTQRSQAEVDQLQVLPVSAHLAQLNDPGVRAWLRERWDGYVAEQRDVLSRSALERLEEVVLGDLDALAGGQSTPRAGFYYNATLSEHTTLWSYLPEGTQVVVHEDGFVESETNSYFRFWDARHKDWLRNGLSFLTLAESYLLPAEGIREAAEGLAQGRLRWRSVVDRDVSEVQQLEIARLEPFFTSSFDSAAIQSAAWPSLSFNFESPATGKWGTAKLSQTVAALPELKPPRARSSSMQATGLNRIDRPLTILSQFSSRLREVLNDAQLYPEIESAILPGGFSFATADGSDWTVVTDVEVFGEIAEVEAAQPKRYRTQAVRKADELSPGDYVVHIDYGIGRFAQLANRDVGGLQKTYAAVEYANKDRLFVPVEQLDRLRRYSFDGSEPQLNSLGKDTWKKTKEKVKRDTLELARKLLSLYKNRQVKPGHAYSEGTVWEQEFADGFPYELTDDQRQAWNDVQSDMEAAKPMDRLIVGDVGFGKTEIAMRAAFKACVDERQVLILCPTTVLADQHYTTFTRRFRAFPFRVGVLSRFQSSAEQRETVDKLRQGRIDVLISTHRGLSKDVQFRSLGLLVIDEEQRFGVKQKEKLRMQFPAVDVLAMSATPIPRSLHLSLVGVRDISIIETAPQSRKAVKTYVGEHDEMLIREAALRELGRGGQIYFLHNRVQDIEQVRERIEEQLPGEKVIVAHGQMADDRLEEVMHAFSLGAYKIMLATTIIENGLDIPAVNTIIVDNAEFLGLSQMHQLRGRVGRGGQQAYAYFFHSPSRLLSEDAQRRLHAIYNYAYLGAGYEIAQSDLRIRGAGNLLGEEQSGLARSVGFEYYCELLARSISDVKQLDQAQIEDWDDSPVLLERPNAQVDLPLPSFIPEDYIEDPVLRLELLRDIAGLDTVSSVGAFADELADRFGPAPAEVLNLLAVVNVRNLATAAGLELVAYNRAKQVFTLVFAGGLPDSLRRVQLIDARFSLSPQNQLMLDLPFGHPEDVPQLAEAIESLIELRQT